MLISFEEISKHFKHGLPRGVIHIGAHKAEELERYHDAGMRTILWVEANPNVFADLMIRTCTHPGSTIHWFAAHDLDDQVIELNVANNGESSSILKFGTHALEHPHVQYVGTVNVPTRKIDTFMESSGFQRELFEFVNIDIQGAELFALKGMKHQLSMCNYIYLEVNEKLLYEGCALVHEIDEFLSGHSFERVATKMTQHGWGDALYVRSVG